MTILFWGTPDAAIWKRAVLGHVAEEAVNKPAQVVYSDQQFRLNAIDTGR